MCVFAFITRPDAGHLLFDQGNTRMSCYRGTPAFIFLSNISLLLYKWSLHEGFELPVVSHPTAHIQHTYLHKQNVSAGCFEFQLRCVTMTENKHISASCVCSNENIVCLGPKVPVAAPWEQKSVFSQCGRTLTCSYREGLLLFKIQLHCKYIWKCIMWWYDNKTYHGIIQMNSRRLGVNSLLQTYLQDTHIS